MTRPLARCIILTDAGSVDYSDALAAYTAPAAGTVLTLHTTTVDQHVLVASVQGAGAALAPVQPAIDAVAAILTTLGV